MGTELSTQLAPAPTTLVSTSIYDRVDPMDYVEKMGRVFSQTKAAGCKTEAEGKLMALACITERKSIFAIAKRYHLMDGKLVTKAEAMLGDFRRRGGKVTWHKNGQDLTEADLELSLDGVTARYAFNIETARTAQYIKDKSNWVKRPDQMLRSRCITDLIRMQWPEISDGDYSEDEIRDEDSSYVSVPSTDEKPAKPGKGGSKASSTAKASTETETVIEAEVESVTSTTETTATTTTEAPPFDAHITANEPGDANESTIPTAADSTFTSNVMEIEIIVPQLGWTNEKILELYNKKFGVEATKFDDYTDEQREFILTKLRSTLEKHKAAQAAK